MISEALLSVVPKDLYSAWISEALLTIIPEDLYFARISKRFFAGIDLYFARISKALLAVCIIRILYWYDRKVFRSCVVCFDFSRKE
jgi:hypothetical protein